MSHSENVFSRSKFNSVCARVSTVCQCAKYFQRKHLSAAMGAHPRQYLTHGDLGVLQASNTWLAFMDQTAQSLVGIFYEVNRCYNVFWLIGCNLYKKLFYVKEEPC